MESNVLLNYMSINVSINITSLEDQFFLPCCRTMILQSIGKMFVCMEETSLKYVSLTLTRVSRDWITKSNGRKKQRHCCGPDIHFMISQWKLVQIWAYVSPYSNGAMKKNERERVGHSENPQGIRHILHRSLHLS